MDIDLTSKPDLTFIKSWICWESLQSNCFEILDSVYRKTRFELFITNINTIISKSLAKARTTTTKCWGKDTFVCFEVAQTCRSCCVTFSGNVKLYTLLHVKRESKFLGTLLRRPVWKGLLHRKSKVLYVWSCTSSFD